MTFAEQQPQRGYHVPYREGEPNHCPGCGGTHWIIGRVSAECGNKRCGLALDLPVSQRTLDRGPLILVRKNQFASFSLPTRCRGEIKEERDASLSSEN